MCIWFHTFREATLKLLINWLNQNCAFSISDTGYLFLWQSIITEKVQPQWSQTCYWWYWLIVQSALKSVNKTTLWFTSVVSLFPGFISFLPNFLFKILFMKLQSNLCFANQVAHVRKSAARCYLIKSEGSITSFPIHKWLCSSAEVQKHLHIYPTSFSETNTPWPLTIVIQLQPTGQWCVMWCVYSLWICLPARTQQHLLNVKVRLMSLNLSSYCSHQSY